jgi:hypothetical protein
LKKGPAEMQVPLERRAPLVDPLKVRDLKQQVPLERNDSNLSALRATHIDR